MKWHTPTSAELELVDRVLEEVLQPELDRLEALMEGKEEMDK